MVAEGFVFQQVAPLLLGGLGKAELTGPANEALMAALDAKGFIVE